MCTSPWLLVRVTDNLVFDPLMFRHNETCHSPLAMWCSGVSSGHTPEKQQIATQLTNHVADDGFHKSCRTVRCRTHFHLLRIDFVQFYEDRTAEIFNENRNVEFVKNLNKAKAVHWTFPPLFPYIQAWLRLVNIRIRTGLKGKRWLVVWVHNCWEKQLESEIRSSWLERNINLVFFLKKYRCKINN